MKINIEVIALPKGWHADGDFVARIKDVTGQGDLPLSLVKEAVIFSNDIHTLFDRTAPMLADRYEELYK